MLWHDFLRKMAGKYELSADQAAVFLSKFSSDKEDHEIAAYLHISLQTVNYRLTEVYKKFSFHGKGTGKAFQLLRFLTLEYDKTKGSGVDTNCVKVEQENELVTSPHRQDACATDDEFIEMGAKEVSEYSSSSNSHSELDELMERAQLFQVASEKLELVKQAVEIVPSVIEAKNDREREAFNELFKDLVEKHIKSNNTTNNYKEESKSDDIIIQTAKQTISSNIDDQKELFENEFRKYVRINDLSIQQQVDLLSKRLEIDISIVCSNFEYEKQHHALSFEKKLQILAKYSKLSDQPINKFFAGEPVDRNVFTKISSLLNIECTKIIDFDFLRLIVKIVPRMRSQCYSKLQEQCGTMRILDVPTPINLNDLYVDVNILEKPSSYQRLERSDLPQIYNPTTDEFDRFGLSKVCEKRVSGLMAIDNYSKLMVLGKPGSGKSTFLQHIAIQCNQGKLQLNRVPIFIRLKTFAEEAGETRDFSLLAYISRELENCDIADESLTEKIVKYGRSLILLDGLDEVSTKDSNEVVKQIRRFCNKYYKNQFIITCRIAAQEYSFPEFTYVEAADFNESQIEKFAKNWFVAVANPSEKEEGKAKAIKFLEKLKQQDNQPIREIAITPILLNLSCLVFQAKAEFPSHKAKLYEEGLEILLTKWDLDRGIKRDEVYRDLNLPHKIKLIAHIALLTFEEGNYFFAQDKIQEYMADYLRRLPHINSDPDRLELDSQAVLKSIEAQHGLLVERSRKIYSFSHLTFHEYFTAKAFLSSWNRQTSDKLILRITEKRWREVFLLMTDMMASPDDFLREIKQQVDAILALDEYLQRFIGAIKQKAGKGIPYKAAAVRGFYFARFLKFSLDLAFNLDRSLKRALQLDRNRDPYPDLALLSDNGKPWIFTEDKKELLKEYHHATILLVDCLNSTSNLTRSVRQEIEDTLLLPIAEIEKRHPQPLVGK
ncbi:NACHT domain-containing protein [Limnofasciculus baicalensis]|uniref:NACHT domain-containing NTPase n=1 Tax=Limnofasciculus baicalensis BBK-W-15 TaxID=2699891 RepID=A0AAE3GMT4_9CYAN|nr:NACHT domain-containing NTPase [Limnofasciculus baicalensis]MCP2727505.1 NACHT domain-containing NTPase [Limnofasciculus baicalensis BBK-W-15]